MGETESQPGEKSEESGDGSEDLEDVEYAGDGKLLIVEIGIDRDVAEDLVGGTSSDDLDGAEGVKDYGVDFAKLYIVDSAFPEGNDVAVADFRLHRVACDVAPDCRLLETRYNDITCGDCCLTVDNLAEPAHKINVEVWCSLPYFERDFWKIRMIIAFIFTFLEFYLVVS